MQSEHSREPRNTRVFEMTVKCYTTNYRSVNTKGVNLGQITDVYMSRLTIGYIFLENFILICSWHLPLVSVTVFQSTVDLINCVNTRKLTREVFPNIFSGELICLSEPLIPTIHITTLRILVGHLHDILHFVEMYHSLILSH